MESTQTLDNATLTFCMHSLSLEKPKHVYLSLLFPVAKEEKVVCVLKSKQTKPELQNKPPSSYVKLLCLVAEWTAKWEGKGVKKKQMAVAICKPEKDSNNQLLSEVLAIKLGCRPGSLYLSLCLGYQHFGMFLHFQSVFSEIFHNVFIYFCARIFHHQVILEVNKHNCQLLCVQC